MLGIAAIGVILMLLAVVLFERARGASQLEEVLGRLRSAQVEIDPAKVVTHSVPDAENAAVALWEITDELRAFSLPEGGETIRAMNYVAPGEACSYVGSTPGNRPRERGMSGSSLGKQRPKRASG
jgi:hypothetical protein